jgi:hypothetical protein
MSAGPAPSPDHPRTDLYRMRKPPHPSVSVWLLLLSLAAAACTTAIPPAAPDPVAPAPPAQMSDDSLMTLVQYRTFQYFWDGAEPNSGLARERYHVDGEYPQNDRHIVTTGGGGFGLMAILVGIERGFITRQQGVDRLERIVNFLDTADRFHGVWPHWLNGETGRVRPFSARDDGSDLVETAFLVQGLLTVRQYLRDGDARERAIADRINRMWREVEWDWHRQGGQNVLYWHWSPQHGWAINHAIRGYDEALIVYVLAAGSPTHPIPPEVYHEGWARGGAMRLAGHSTYGYNLELRHNGAEQYGGPLFWAHYSYLGLDPRGLRDRYASDYFEHNRNHTLINRAWCLEQPQFGYGPGVWGLTASYTRNPDGGVGYHAHRPGSDRGVIAPTAALSSIPYTPEESLQAMRHFYYELGNRLWGPYGFYDAFSLQHGWFPQRYLAIDQGPIVVMIENHRTGLLWDLFMTAPEVKEGLRRLDFQSPHLARTMGSEWGTRDGRSLVLEGALRE